MFGKRELLIADRMTRRDRRRDRWHLRERERPRDNRPLNRDYVARVPSAVDRVRFSRFVERALSGARRRGLTDPQIETATGVKASTFHRWRRGEVAPTVDKVRSFCAGLGLDPTEALAALGVGARVATPPPPLDPDVEKLLRLLADPNVNAETKEFIRQTLRMLASLPRAPRTTSRRRKSA
jgi:transcriptional regulator with XRE-family HTH domain